MPVIKFRTIEESGRELWRDPLAPGHWERIGRVLVNSFFLLPRAWPPGVYLHRSIADANAQREAWESRTG